MPEPINNKINLIYAKIIVEVENFMARFIFAQAIPKLNFSKIDGGQRKGLLIDKTPVFRLPKE